MFESVSDAIYDLVMMAASNGYAPHAVCLLNDPAIIASEVVTNIGVALAYFMIPLALWRFIQIMGTAFPLKSVVTMFMIFIFACGTSHLTRVATLFVGGWTYWLDAAVCGITMVSSIGTALVLYFNADEITTAIRRILNGLT